MSLWVNPGSDTSSLTWLRWRSITKGRQMTCMVTLKRICENENGTFGVLIGGNKILCVTLERRWLNNQEGVSCIPSGTYNCIPHNSPEHPNTWEITGVEGRTDILIHTGNDANTESLGCILVARQFTPDGIILSKMAMDDLRNQLPPNFTLTIETHCALGLA